MGENNEVYFRKQVEYSRFHLIYELCILSVQTTYSTNFYQHANNRLLTGPNRPKEGAITIAYNLALSRGKGGDKFRGKAILQVNGVIPLMKEP